MFDTSSFRIRYKAPVEKPALLFVGPGIVAFLLLLSLVHSFLVPMSLGSVLPAGLLSLLLPISLIAVVALAVELWLGADEGYPWRRSFAASGSGLLGGTLLVAAWAKVLDPVAFQEGLTQEGLGGLVPVALVGLVAIALEVFLGSALVLGVRRMWTLVATGLLVAFFLFLNGRSYLAYMRGATGDDAACGCFGNLLERTPAEAFWQDFFLLVPTLAMAALGLVVRARLNLRIAVAGALAAAACGFAFFAPDLPLDDVATRLHPGLEVSSICTGSGDERLCLPTLVPELAAGSHLVVLADLEDGGLARHVESLNRYWLGGAEPRLWVLAAATPEQSQAFFWQHGPSFEIREAPPTLLRPLYRQLPKSFVVEDGVVAETYAGIPAGIVTPVGAAVGGSE
ncbi:MAG: hypothetical protein R3190_12595 [Thermoanaerobaculia bacterium]|nr:hypothetical protein [Thermoanaerobaculia bacterium]